MRTGKPCATVFLGRRFRRGARLKKALEVISGFAGGWLARALRTRRAIGCRAHSEHVEVERHEEVPAPEAQLEPAETEDVVEEEAHVPEPHFDPEEAAETPEEPAHEVAEAHPAAEAEEAAEATAKAAEGGEAEAQDMPAPTEKAHKPHKMNAMDIALGTPKHHDEAR